MEFINTLLLAYARQGWGEWARKSAARKYRRRNSGSPRRITTLFGFNMDVTIGEDSVDTDIAINGLIEPETAHILKRLFEDSKSLIDVGCNIGFYSCLFAHINPEAPIDAIDPNPAMVERTRHNLELGEAKNAQVHARGVGDQAGTLVLHIAKNRHSLSSFAFVPSRGGGSGQDINVEVDRLMNIVDARRQSKDIFVKIDTEGFEHKVLAGISREEAQAFRYLCFEHSQENLRNAGISHESVFLTPWMEDFDAYIIQDMDSLLPLKNERRELAVIRHCDVVLVRRGVPLPGGIRILASEG